MEITKEALLARQKVLLQQKDNLIVNLNAVDGALLDVQYWQQELDKVVVEKIDAKGAGSQAS